MKQRFSSLDVRAISHELDRSLAGARLSNVYDLVPPSAAGASLATTPRALLLRFARGQDKLQLVVDSGFRCHLTAYDVRAAASSTGAGGSAAVAGGARNAPSAFVSRLRTFLAGRHVVAVAQVGTDRIVELRFSDGQLRLYLEFFAAGNIVLTDADAKVLALQRTVAAFRSASLDATLNVGSQYGIGAKQNVSGVAPLTVDKVRAVLEAAAAADEAAADETAAADQGSGAPAPAVKKNKSKKNKKSLSRILALAFTDLPQVLIDHALLSSGYVTAETAAEMRPADVLADASRTEALFRALQEARALAEGLTRGPTCKGYIVAIKKEEEKTEGEKEGAETKTDLDYTDFHPFRPQQFEANPKYHLLTFDSFNKAADEFYSHLQGLKADRQSHHRESAASKKLEATRRDQAQRIDSLQEAQQLNMRKAAAIEANQDWVQAAIDAVNEQLSLGTDWGDLAQLIESSASSNPVAAIIKLPLRLAESSITLRLSEEAVEWGEEEEEEEEEGGEGDDDDQPTLDVDVKLTLSAWSNARAYHDQKRVAAIKEQKTKEVTSLALRNAEKKVAEELKRVQKDGKPAPQLIRRQHWFEKYTWFLSSDGYLVLAAKERHQCELLYRRHLRRGDVYVHADVRGSPGIIVVKQQPGAAPDAPIPPATLAQAGTLAICASEAWETKAGLGAFWVRADQVFKTTVGGDVLPQGTFDVRGEKNHLAPPLRVLGFGLMFKISDGSQANHAKGLVEEEPESDEDLRPEHSPADGPPVEEKPEDKTGPGKGDKAVEEEQAPAGDGAEAGEDDEHAESQTPQSSESQTARESTQSSRTLVRAVSPAPSRTSTAKTTDQAVSKRGQKAKAKKLAKYRDQDDEDRARAEILIGVAAGREKAEAKARAKAQREAEIAAYEERRRAQREKQERATREYEAARQARLLQGGGDDDGDGDDDDNQGVSGEGDLGLLSTLVGRPAPGDEILEVVPVCAPWTALARLKYKVKIQPGQTKKGRAVRDILERWRHAADTGRASSAIDEHSQDPERMWPREVDLIRSIKMEEASNCVPVGKMTLMLSGGLGGGGSSGGGKTGGKTGGGGKGSGKQPGQGSGKKTGGRGGKKK